MIGERIKELRKKNRYTQKQIGAMCGVSDISVYNWERNKVEPNTDTLCRLADIFGVSVDYLLGRTTEHEIKKEAPPAMAEGEAEVSFSLLLMIFFICFFHFFHLFSRLDKLGMLSPS